MFLYDFLFGVAIVSDGLWFGCSLWFGVFRLACLLSGLFWVLLLTLAGLVVCVVLCGFWSAGCLCWVWVLQAGLGCSL